MFCTKCGQKNNEDARFCSRCGTPVINEVHSNQQTTQPPAPVNRENHIEPVKAAGLSTGVKVAIGAVAAVIIGVIIFSTGSGSNNIVGRWEGVSVTSTFFGETIVEELQPGEAFWEVYADGTGAIIEGRGSGRENFTWRIESGRFLMTDSTGETIPIRYNISGSTLTITMDEFPDAGINSVVMTLRRVRGNGDNSSKPTNNGSTPTYAQELIGKWEGVSVDSGLGYVENLSRNELFWEFKANGEGTAIEGRFTDRFTWRTEGNSIYMTEPSSGEQMQGTYSISGSNLTINLSDGYVSYIWKFRSAN